MGIINLTSNLKLGKPTSEERYDVEIQNTNMDILDTSLKRIFDSISNLATNKDLLLHVENKNNPHKVTKEQLGLSNVVNKKQIYGISGNVTTGGIPVFDGDGYTVKDSGFTIATSVPANAKFTDTTYGIGNNNSPGLVKSSNSINIDIDGSATVINDSHSHDSQYYNKNSIDEKIATKANSLHIHDDRYYTKTEINNTYADKSYVDSELSNANQYTDSSIVNKVDKIDGMGLSSNDYTTAEKNKLSGIESGAQRNVISGIKGDAESSYRTGQVNITKANIGLGNTEDKSSEQIRNEITKANVVSALGYLPEIEGAYENATAYTDMKFMELTGISSESIEAINKLSETVSDNQNLIDTLNNSIHSKANQVELDTHIGNSTIHITSTERTDWNAAKIHANSNHARTDATKVESSSVNGNVKINGTETVVYTHPNGTNPHGTTKADIGLGNVPNVTTNNQTPTFSENSTRVNIVSGEKLSVILGKIKKWFTDLKTVAFSGSYNDLTDKPTIPSAYNDTALKNLINAKISAPDYSNMVDLSGYFVYNTIKTYTPPRAGIISISFYATEGTNCAISVEHHGLTRYMTVCPQYGVVNTSCDFVVDANNVNIKKLSDKIQFRHAKFIPLK